MIVFLQFASNMTFQTKIAITQNLSTDHFAIFPEGVKLLSEQAFKKKRRRFIPSLLEVFKDLRQWAILPLHHQWRFLKDTTGLDRDGPARERIMHRRCTVWDTIKRKMLHVLYHFMIRYPLSDWSRNGVGVGVGVDIFRSESESESELQ